MLVLSRKEHEQIRIGESIMLTILKTQGNTVRIGIEAPREVRVLRGELPPRDPDGKVDAPNCPHGTGGVPHACLAALK